MWNFLTKLQSLNEPTKRKVLIVSTIVIMVVVLFVWVAYFNSIIIPSAAQTDTAQVAATATSTAPIAAASAGNSGFWRGVKDGVINLFHGGSQTIKPSY